VRPQSALAPPHRSRAARSIDFQVDLPGYFLPVQITEDCGAHVLQVGRQDGFSSYCRLHQSCRRLTHVVNETSDIVLIKMIPTRTSYRGHDDFEIASQTPRLMIPTNLAFRATSQF
jgi:hypothetical protein